MVHIERRVRFDRLVLRHRHHVPAARTDKGVIFVTLEDEIGSVNIIACGHIRVRAAWCCCAHACSLRPGSGRPSTTALHLIARRPVNVTPWLGSLASSSRDSD